MTHYKCKWCGWEWQSMKIEHTHCIMCGLRLQKLEGKF